MGKFTKMMVALCATVGFSTTMQAKDVYVSATGNDSNSGLTADAPKATLNGLNGVISAGDVVHVKGFLNMANEKAAAPATFDKNSDCGVWGNDNNGGVQGFYLQGRRSVINDWQDVVFEGEDPEEDGFSGNGETQLFFSSGGDVTYVFRSLGFKNGITNSEGGVIYVKDNGHLAFENCQFLNNHIDMSQATASQDGIYTKYNANVNSERGGAIRVEYGQVTIDGSYFEGNFNKKGGGVCITGGRLEVTNTTFYRNGYYDEENENAFLDEQTGGGQAIFAWALNTATTVKIDHCLFDSNRAWNAGGAVTIWSNVGYQRYTDMTITNSAFFNNFAERGGAIATCNGYSMAEGGKDNPKNIFLKVANTTISQNTARADGGAVCMWGGAVGPTSEYTHDRIYFVNTTIFGNQTLGNAGHGAGYKEMKQENGGAIMGNPDNVDRYFYNTIIEGNIALDANDGQGEYSDFTTAYGYQYIKNSRIGRFCPLDGLQTEDWIATLNDGAGLGDDSRQGYSGSTIGGTDENPEELLLDDGSQTTTTMYETSNGIIQFIPVPDDSELLNGGDATLTQLANFQITAPDGVNIRTINGYDVAAEDQVGFTRGSQPVIGAIEATLSDIIEEDENGNTYFDGSRTLPYLTDGIQGVVVSNQMTFNRNGYQLSVDGAMLTVYDLQGRSMAYGKENVSLASLPAGVYVVKAVVNGKTESVKVVK